MKKIKIIIILFMIIMCFYTIESIASGFKFTITPEEIQADSGEEIKIKLNVSDIETEAGINVLQGVLEFDDEIIEHVEVEASNNWSIEYNEDNNMFLAIILSGGVKEDQEIGKIKFKTKKNLEGQRSKIIFKDLQVSGYEETMKTGDKIAEFTINSPQIDTHIEDKETLEMMNNEKKENYFIWYVIIGFLVIVIIIIVMYIIKLIKK